MASVHIRRRTVSNDEQRYDVRYRQSGRSGPIHHAGTFQTLEEAEQRKALVARQLAAGVARIRIRDVPDARATQWVYFVRHGEHGPIKIGTAGDVERRLRSLQSGNPVTLVLLGAMPAWGGEESELHAAFAEHRIRGEWFRPHPDLIAYVRDVCGDWEWPDEVVA